MLWLYQTKDTRGKIAPRTSYVKIESDAVDHWVDYFSPAFYMFNGRIGQNYEEISYLCTQNACEGVAKATLLHGKRTK